MSTDTQQGAIDGNTEEETQMLDAINKWLERDVRANVMEFDHGDIYPEEMVKQMIDLGLFGAIIGRFDPHEHAMLCAGAFAIG